jgi:ADP-ribosylation factor-binding protein GGA
LIDFDDSAPASSETTSGGGGNDLAGLFSYVAQPTQAPAQYRPPQQQPQQQPPSTYAPTPLFYNNNGGGMNTFMQSTPNSMVPHRQLSGTPPASIALPQSKPGSQRSTPVPAAATPNYFGNVGARGPVGGMGMNRGMGSGLPMSMPGINAGGAPSAMNLSGAMSGMSLNGGGNKGMGSVMFHPQSTVPQQHQQPQQATTTSAAPPHPPPPASGTDPFADLAGLF